MTIILFFCDVEASGLEAEAGFVVGGLEAGLFEGVDHFFFGEEAEGVVFGEVVDGFVFSEKVVEGDGGEAVGDFGKRHAADFEV